MKMKIQDFTPIALLTQARLQPNAQIMLVFDNDKDPVKFFTNFVQNSQLRLTISKTERGTYKLNFTFPKHNGYTLSLEPPTSENSVYEELFDKNIAITCGFRLPDGKIAGLSTSYVLDNKISLN